MFDALVYDEDGTLRVNEELTSSTEHKTYGRDYAKYPTRIAEELQCYGANSFASALRDAGVLYREILCEVCNKLKVNYNEKSETSLIEQSMLAKILEKSLEKMSDEKKREIGRGLDIKNIDSLSKQALSTAFLGLLKTNDLHAYQLAMSVANSVVGKTLGGGLTAVVGKVALKKTLGILAGPIGWVITGALVSINLAGPAYRVTVPACVLVATLRKKLKAEQEARLKAEQEANEKKMWYLVIIFCILIGLAVLAVFFIKGKHHSSNDPSNNPKSGVENLKNPSHKKLKNNNNRSN